MTCATNMDCANSPNGTVCNMTTKTCVVCAGDSTCGAGLHCTTKGDKCVQCIKPSDCAPGTVCGSDGSCHSGCDTNSPCAKGTVCLNNACVQCAQSSDCMMGRCDPNTHTCVTCLADTDCTAGNVCRTQMCVPGCSADQHCPAGKVCDLNAGACVQCTSDGDCKGSSTPRCDIHTNTCVACLPGSDNCPAGQYCANETCVSGCKSDTDCQAGNPSPASQGMAFCSLATNQCVGCLKDSQCPQNNRCVNNACAAGCNSDAQCGVGTSCCSNQCVPLNNSANCGVCGNACSSGQACCGGTCTNTNTLFNCGGCGITCTTGQTCCGSGCSNLLTDPNNCGACGNKCAAGQTCCSGFCKNPNQPGVCIDCTKSCTGYSIAGGQFSQFGSTSQLTVDNTNGLSTQPATTTACTQDSQCATGYFCLNNTCQPRPATAPHVWVANHDTNQVSRIDANTGALLGTYASGGGNPSRGAMALDGTFWVGHRGQDCNVNDPSCSNVTNILADGTIRCTVKYAADGAVLPFVRALAIDKNGYIWFGTWNDARIHKADPNTCKVVFDATMQGLVDPKTGVSGSSNPYGMTIDGNGILWVSTIGSGPWMGFDTTTGKIAHIVPLSVPGYGNRASYGLTTDKANNVWLADWCGTGAIRIDHTSFTTSYMPLAPQENGWWCPRGMSIDTDGKVWGMMGRWNNNCCGWTNYAAKVDPTANNGTGAFIRAYQENSLTQGVYINGDPFGNIWAAGTGAGNQAVIRFPRSITSDNQADFVTKMQGGWPYSYADSTGIVLRTVTTNDAQDGTWTMAFDGQQPNTNWETATWVGNVPAGTQVNLRFRAATSFGTLAQSPLCGPFPSTNGVAVQGGQQYSADITTCGFGTKQWLGVYVELVTNNVNVQPTVGSLKVYYQN